MAGYKMRINFVDVIVDNSLKNIWLGGAKIGYQFDVRLSYYRGHFLSVIDELSVRLDGQEVAQERLRFHLNGKSFGVCELRECYTEFWNLLDAATISVEQPGGLPVGEHEVDLTLVFRSPYMPIGPNHQYMPVDSSGIKTLTVTA